MIKTILAVVDGANPDHGSIQLAIRWASNTNALLVGLGVIDESITHRAESVPLGASEAKHELDAARLHEQQLAIETCLSEIALQCANQGVSFKPLEDLGRPTHMISVEAQRFDVIVMPRYLRDGSEPAELGLSKALSSVLHAAPRPVVAVPEQVGGGEAVVIAYDGSLQAARTLQQFEASGLSNDRPIHVVSVQENSHEAAACGNRAVEFLDFHGIRAALHVEKHAASPAKKIIECANRLNAGLLVMGAYGQPCIREFILGSATKDILANCSIPVFLYH